ncbi:MAG: ABC transporter permease, partial [Bacteroidota bacterium]
MKLSLRMAWRYLFAKKSTNAINIITLIAAFGVAIGSAALVLALSVFNGFEDLFMGMFNNLNPDVEITAAKGKSFNFTNEQKDALYNIDGVAQVSATLEETAFFTYRGKRSAGKVRGVDDNYVNINSIDTTIRQGFYQLRDGSNRHYAVIGLQLAYALGVDVLDQFEALNVYMAKRKRGGSALTSGSPFLVRPVFPVGIVQSQEAFENQAVLIDIQLARNLLGLADSAVSAVAIKLHPGFANSATYEEIQRLMGPDFLIKNRLQQESGILKLMQIEKWITFAIVALMMILISFNLVGALWMIVLEKQKDVAILRSMGMTTTNIRGVFLRVGLLLTGLGLLVGFIIAVIVGLLQHYFTVVPMPGSFTEAYPLA